jgi:tetratricopeptide (TPR) repeat protein
MTTASPSPSAEDIPGNAPLVQMSGTSHDSSTFTQVAGDQYNIQLPPKPPAPATCTLPADTAAFTGRTKELHDMITAVAGTAEAGRVVAIHAIDGMPGVGKTALAVHVGHLLADRFPDRQLFVDLHAHTAGQEPVTAEAALASLLTADGMDSRYLPDSLDERATLWRDRMAHKQALLILDNAVSSGQVVPLLPGSAGCLVLVTSRRYLGDLPSAVPVPLDILPPAEAQQMFLRLAPRAAAEPARVAELVGLCGCLPLAISLLARLFSTRRSWTMGNLINETKTTLLAVTAENRTVAAAFDLSHQYLPTNRQHFFRRLGLHPGVDIDAYAAAALTSLPLDQSSDHLDALYSDHLLDEPVYRRYRMHDLIRDYARTLAAADPADERNQALGQLLDYYQHTAALADAHLTRHTRPPAATSAASPGPVPALASLDHALAWLRIERANLRSCLDHATRHTQHARVVGLTAGVASLLRSDGPWSQALELHANAAAAARHLADRIGEANAFNDLGVVRRLTGDYPGAARAYEQALGIYRGLGDRLGEANVLMDLGVVRRLTGDYPGAARAYEQALGIYCGLGDRLGEANVLMDLGVVRRLTGDYPGAARAQEQALGIYRGLGDRLGEANALYCLGFVWRVTGDYLGAAQAYEQALGAYRDLGSRLGEANALNELGVVWRVTGDYLSAAQAQEQALGIYHDLGNRLGEANALDDLGVVRQETGDYPGAAQALEQALGIYHDLGYQLGEAAVFNHSGTLCLKSGDPEQALAHHQRALDLARAVDSPLEQAHALDGISRCALARGDTATAVAERWQALEIYQRIGAAEATQLATDLADLDAE